MNDIKSANEDDNTWPGNKGRVLAGRYEILDRIGAGGTSTVYKARDQVLKRFVAVKLLRAGGRSEEQLIRLQREARAICQLKHNHIIEVYDFIVGDGNMPVLAMEYVKGESLNSLIKREGPLPLEETIAICDQISDALSYAHQHHIMHRDLKPANIIIQSRSPLQIKVIDFGIAKLLDEDGSLTSSGTIVGTPSYISPEQARGEDADYRGDSYSLGCLMYTILTGSPPFRGPTMVETLHAQIHELAPTLHDGNPKLDYPAELEAIVAKALQKDPMERYQTMDEMRLDLNALVQPANEDFETVSEVQNAPETAKVEIKLFPIALLTVLLVLGVVCYQIAKNVTPSVELDQITTGKYSASAELQKDNKIAERKIGRFTWYSPAGKKLTESQLQQFEAKKVQRLSVAHTDVTDAHLERIAKLPLILLDIRDTKVSNKGIQTICDKRPDLQALIIEKCPNIDSEGYRKIAELKNLHVLSLRDTNVSDADVELFSTRNDLYLLYVSRSPNITDACIPHLLRMENLYSVRLDRTKVTPKGINRLASLKKLVFIGIGQLNITGENMPNFSKNISMIDFQGNPITPEALRAKVLPLPELWYLDLRNCEKINSDKLFSRQLLSLFGRKKARVCLLDEHEGMPMPEWYFDPTVYHDGKRTHFTRQERLDVINEAINSIDILNLVDSSH